MAPLLPAPNCLAGVATENCRKRAETALQREGRESEHEHRKKKEHAFIGCKGMKNFLTRIEETFSPYLLCTVVVRMFHALTFLMLL
jgi:hypothetical protein